ncbi:AAA family ATPase [Patescibacteria group bacterium]|nr:AAA family ATPase [Patescibacteria group bacterium]
MVIKSLGLSNFRNFKKKVISFSPMTTVIIGPNAAGKTNILEAILLLSLGKSFKAKIEEEMINYGAEIARVSARITNKQSLALRSNELRIKANKQSNHNTKYIIHDTDLEVVLTRGEITVGENPVKVETAPRKRLLVNGLTKRLIDFAGNFKAVFFGPWDLDLITASPTLRRKFLDAVISQVDREYRRATLSYEKGLRRRNRILLRIKEEGISRSNLVFWDKLLIKNGDYISAKREEFIQFANNEPRVNEQTFSLTYDKSAISEGRIEQYKIEEVAAATTLVGPHRDDFIVKIKNEKAKRISRSMIKNGRELARFGSRGEQRMSVLWLKLAELSFIKEKSRSRPTLLLDDIFSELDHEHKEVVLKVAKGQQTIITTADPHFIEDIKGITIIKV